MKKEEEKLPHHQTTAPYARPYPHRPPFAAFASGPLIPRAYTLSWCPARCPAPVLWCAIEWLGLADDSAPADIRNDHAPSAAAPERLEDGVGYGSRSWILARLILRADSPVLAIILICEVHRNEECPPNSPRRDPLPRVSKRTESLNMVEKTTQKKKNHSRRGLEKPSAMMIR